MSKLEEIPEWIVAYDKANYQSSAGKAVRFLMERVKQLSESHREEIEDLERKAWECSVELMEDYRKEIDGADKAQDRGYEYVRRSGLAAGYKYSAYKLRDAFGFSRSETPERFKK